MTTSLWPPLSSTALGFRFGCGTLLPRSCHHWPLLLSGIQGRCHQARSYHLLLGWHRGRFWPKIQGHSKFQRRSCRRLRLCTCIQPNTQPCSQIHTHVWKQQCRYWTVPCFRNASRCSGDIKWLCTSFVSSRRRRWKGLKGSSGKDGEKQKLLN